jgi:diadenosine tetraphosphatase ApaH/serine/threonine PP2A family protein phosphatase
MEVDSLIERVNTRQRIRETEINAICNLAKEIFYQEGTIINLTSPISVCGDVHGQFHDVLRIFEIGGNPSDTKYLFLGDYVDRGFFSLETILLLLLYKIKYPSTFFMLRGNHETRHVNEVYGFYNEMFKRYHHSEPWKLINTVFDLLPIGAVIDNWAFCVHGGLSPDIKLIEQIALLERRIEIPEQGPLCDIIWSDPDEIEGWRPSERGAGYLFGIYPTREFCHNNRINLIMRAHQLVMEGHTFNCENAVLTVWSAPNYMYRSGNIATVAQVASNREITFLDFEAVPETERIQPDDDIPTYFV